MRTLYAYRRRRPVRDHPVSPNTQAFRPDRMMSPQQLATACRYVAVRPAEHSIIPLAVVPRNGRTRAALTALLLCTCASVAHSQTTCNQKTLSFIVPDSDTVLASLEDDIRTDLAKVGITVNTRKLTKEAFNTAMKAGDWNL
jgi:hypothetical protein